MKSSNPWKIALAAALALPAAALAGISFGLPIADHGVLQRDMPIVIFGHGASGARVTVEFDGQKKDVAIDADGIWRAEYPARAASTNGLSATVTSGDEKLEVHDLVVGDVWLCAGQSNMEWPLSKDAHAKEELPAAEDDALRLFNMPFAGQYQFAKAFDAETIARLKPETFYSGTWAPCTTNSAKAFSAIGYYFGREIRREQGVPVGMINLSVGGSPIEAWIRREALARSPELAGLVKGNWLKNPELKDWSQQRGMENLKAAPPLPNYVIKDELGPNHPFKPGFLWEAGPQRLLPMHIRGVLWYQGESNSQLKERVEQHAKLFPLLVNSWRTQWCQGDFPFLFVQLSAIKTNNYASQFWPEFRDQQRRFVSTIPACAMAVSSDCGNPASVHPTEKRAIGHRLAIEALRLSYGQTNRIGCPMPLRTMNEPGRIVLTFSDAGSGLKTTDGKPPATFEIAGDDGVFHRAVGLLGGESIGLSSPQVATPVKIRYGWQPYPERANVVNSDGLPVSTFVFP